MGESLSRSSCCEVTALTITPPCSHVRKPSKESLIFSAQYPASHTIRRTHTCPVQPPLLSVEPVWTKVGRRRERGCQIKSGVERFHHGWEMPDWLSDRPIKRSVDTTKEKEMKIDQPWLFFLSDGLIFYQRWEQLLTSIPNYPAQCLFAIIQLNTI